MSDYPEKADLDKIANWPQEDFQGWMEFIATIWWGNEEGNYVCEHVPGEWAVSTVGWSGNEEIISTMRKNQFMWMCHWYSSKRGGHYIFRSRDTMFTND